MIGQVGRSETSSCGQSASISAGPMTLELTPSSLFTSARSCIVTSARSECASVRCPRCENMRLKPSFCESFSYNLTLCP